MVGFTWEKTMFNVILISFNKTIFSYPNGPNKKLYDAITYEEWCIVYDSKMVWFS